MASPRKRLSRKELRQPDWFQTRTEEAFELFETHRLKVLLGLAVVVLFLAGLWGWSVFKQRENSMAAREFGEAMTKYHAGKYQEAIAGFEKVQAYRWSRYSSLAHLYAANSYLALSELPKAATAAQRFIVATDEGSLMRQIGLLTLATVDERESRCKDAIEHYRDAANIKGAFSDQAYLGEARCSVQLGDIGGGIAAYRQVLKNQPESMSANYLKNEIAVLEAKQSPAK